MPRRASRDHGRVHGRMSSWGGELGKRGQMLRTRAVEVSLWEAVLPEEVLRLPEELARVDALLDDPVFFAPFVPFFDPRLGRPSTPMETYLRLMFLKFRYRLRYESLLPGGVGLHHLAAVLPDRPRPAGAPSDHVDEAEHPLRLGRGRRVERGAAGEGGGGEAAALHPDPGGQHGGAVECGLSDRLWLVGAGGEEDRGDRAADPGRGGCGAD